MDVAGSYSIISCSQYGFAIYKFYLGTLLSYFITWNNSPMVGPVITDVYKELY